MRAKSSYPEQCVHFCPSVPQPRSFLHSSSEPQPPTPKGTGKKKPAEEEAPSTSLEEIRALRIEKVTALRAQGSEPYAYTFDRTHKSAELQALYAALQPGEEQALPEGSVVRVCGRLKAKRVFGKLAFAALEDDSGSIQVYIDKGRLSEDLFNFAKNTIDIGDIVGVTALAVKRTEKGELSVIVHGLDLLTKALLPLPDKWHGLTDVEKRYRQRYLDMICTPSVRNTFRSRSRIISTIRRALEAKEFIEVETPVLQSEAGGADARPFITYHNSLERNFTLRIATELHLKRLVVGGFERVFEIGRIFRNEGISARHNPEFTSIELYQAYADYSDMMDLTEQLIRTCAQEVCGAMAIDYQGIPIDLGKPFRRASMGDLVREATGVDVLSFGAQGAEGLPRAKEAVLAAVTGKEGVGNKELGKIRGAPSLGHLLNEAFEAVVEGTLMQPTFVMDHPVEISPLAKPHRATPGLTERFELFVYARELANSFSELTDPVDQRRRLEDQIKVHAGRRADMQAAAASSGKPADIDPELDYDINVDEDFVNALEYGMPPTAGLGIGIDRLVMLLTDSASIRDVIAFPLMK